MNKPKNSWDKLLEYSTTIATILVLTVCAVGLMFVVGVAVVISKLAVFVK